MARLLEIMATLRSGRGCPWDREQTLESIKPYLIEEAYEVIDAVDAGDIGKHQEELGDLLLQVVFHAQLRREQGRFEFDDVVRCVCDKLIRRHPHVFGGVRVDGAEEVLRRWEAIKVGERGKGAASVLDGIPRHLPALRKAHQVQGRAARVGFDWKALHDVVAKVDEELAELRSAMASATSKEVKEEIGDLLFAVVNVARFLKIDPEDALSETVRKFIRRFHEVERRLTGDGTDLRGRTLEEMDAVWEEVKRRE
jgi:tetrapyrrole methylase family protein/MazG family protein